MKDKLIRIAAALILFTTLIGILPAFGSETPVYSTESNSGQRDIICTTLDGTGAEDYYGNEYSYDRLSELSADYLYDALAELMTDTHEQITTYANCRDYATITDCENNDGRVMMIYTSYSAARSDYNTGNSGWNREHVWPKSLGGFDEIGAGADLHHIRPSNAKVNSTRGNKLYGEISGGTTVTCTMGGSTLTGGYYSGNYFEPIDNVKGDVARICLYVYVRWAEEFPECGDITNVFQNVDVLLEWCALDPVDTWEMGRNEVVGEIQGNRNVFIDYPEYAWQLFGREVPADMITPSGEATEGEGGQGGTASCTHKNTVIKNATVATCGKDGYSGDIYCKDCGEKLLAGKSIAATGNHSFGAWKTASDGSQSRTCSVCKKVETVAAADCQHIKTEIRNAVAPTCKDEGYSGDIHCAGCGKLIVAGSTIPVTNDHSFGEWIAGEDGKLSRTCATCDTVEMKDCPHANTEIRDTINATCKTEGYTGDTYCKDCNAKTESGTAIFVTDDHSFGQWITDKGKQSRTCSVCGKIETIPCPHAHTEVRNAIDPTCKEGYSGDVYCADCGEVSENGMVYPPVAAHRYDPNTGRLICTVCGYESITQAAEAPNELPILWIVVGAVTLAGIGVAIILIVRKRRS